jgi:predicted kinase
MVDPAERLQPPAWLVGRDVARLRETLGELPPAAPGPALVALTGLPGTGKSYFAARLREALGGRVVVLESDALRKALVARPTYSLLESARLFGACHALIEELLAEGRVVVFDATNLFARGRRELEEIADRRGARYLLVRLFAPRALALERIGKRLTQPDGGNQSEAGPEVYEKMRLAEDWVTESHLAVNTARDIGPAMARVARWVISAPA